MFNYKLAIVLQTTELVLYYLMLVISILEPLSNVR